MSALYEPVEIPLWMTGCEDALSAVVIVNWLFSPCVCYTKPIPVSNPWGWSHGVCSPSYGEHMRSHTTPWSFEDWKHGVLQPVEDPVLEEVSWRNWGPQGVPEQCEKEGVPERSCCSLEEPLEELRAKEWSWAWGTGVGRKHCLNLSLLLTNWQRIKLIFLKSSLFCVTVIGEWSSCLYLNPGAFPSYFLPGLLRRGSERGGGWASGSQQRSTCHKLASFEAHKLLFSM